MAFQRPLMWLARVGALVYPDAYNEAAGVLGSLRSGFDLELVWCEAKRSRRTERTPAATPRRSKLATLLATTSASLPWKRGGATSKGTRDDGCLEV